jgi:uncharacterized protein YfdQ (DUF2303 family)
MKSENQSTVRDIEALVRSSTVHVPESSGAEVGFVVIPDGHTLKDIEHLGKSPRRIRERLEFNTVESLIDYMKAWATDRSVIFANDKSRALAAVIDYHKKDTMPAWADHRASYTAKFSRELLAWQGNDGKPMPQIAFAEFIEDRIADVVEPKGADLLERALKLQFITKGVFGSAVRLQSGEFQLTWSEEQEKGTVELPEKIAIGIPLFHNGKSYKIPVRLRYRLGEGKVTFTYKLVDIEAAIEHAFADVVRQVRESLPTVGIFQGARSV